MDTDFERGKKLIIEGIEGLIRIYEPAIKLFRGLQMLGITEGLGDFVKLSGDIDTWDSLVLALNTFIADFRKAQDMDEAKQTLERARDFFKRLC